MGLLTVSPGSVSVPWFVRVESAAVDCDPNLPPANYLGYLTVQYFDTLGQLENGKVLEKEATVSLRVDASQFHSVFRKIAVSSTRFSWLSMLTAKNHRGWMPLGYGLERDELGVFHLTVGNLANPSCFALGANLPAIGSEGSGPGAQSGPPSALLNRSQPGGQASDPVVFMELGGSSSPVSPLSFDVVSLGEPHGRLPTFPWLPVALIVAGALLMVFGLAWLFFLLLMDRRRRNKTFARPRKPTVVENNPHIDLGRS